MRLNSAGINVVLVCVCVYVIRINKQMEMGKCDLCKATSPRMGVSLAVYYVCEIGGKASKIDSHGVELSL